MAYQPQVPSITDEDTNNTSGVRFYSPYQDLNLPTHFYKLPTTPEILFPEDSRVERRTGFVNLTYYTGISYISGATMGGVKGFVDSVKAIESGDTLKVKLNRILNGSGQIGRHCGNRLGIMGLIYVAVESGIVSLRDTDDIINSVLAGLGTGALYKASAGPRSAAVAGAIGGVVVGLAVAGKQGLKRYVPYLVS